jgi:hypothetical protein
VTIRRFYERTEFTELKALAAQFKAVAVAGPWPSGKTTYKGIAIMA